MMEEYKYSYLIFDRRTLESDHDSPMRNKNGEGDNFPKASVNAAVARAHILTDFKVTSIS